MATPSLDDHAIKPEEFEEVGTLSGKAAEIIMTMLYGARLVRVDLLWPICSLTCEITRWTEACDRRLHRLVAYLHRTIDHSLESFVGDLPEDCVVLLYSDAGFAGAINTCRSTSGCYVAIVGPNAVAPICAAAKKQKCISHSSTESGFVAAEEGVRTEGLPIL